ncbi:reverse transcriptase domain-containing protein [Tanacetum coccineum]
MSVRLAGRSFQYPVIITKNMLVKVGKFTFPVDFVILKMEEDSKVPFILGRHFLHTADVVIRVKQKQLNLGVDEILEDFDALVNEGSKILYSIEGTPIEDEILAEFNEFIAMNKEENIETEHEEEELAFEKITFDTDYKIKKSLKEPITDLELKPLPNHLEYAFLERTFSFL